LFTIFGINFKFEGGSLMGHDISGYNKAGQEIAYARFSMGNYNSIILYSLLDADKYYAGVSGNGGSSTFSMEQIEKASNDCKQLFKQEDSSSSDSDSTSWDQKQIEDFIKNCYKTAQKEGNVKIYFG
jgi:hypothetical protein